ARPTSFSISSNCRARSVATQASVPNGHRGSRAKVANRVSATPRSFCNADLRQLVPRSEPPTTISTRIDEPHKSNVGARAVARLSALPAPRRVPANLAGQGANLVQRPGQFIRAARRTAADRWPRDRSTGSQSHRPAVYRRLRRRVALPNAQAVRLRTRRVSGATGRRTDAGRRAYHHRRAFRPAEKQADPAGNQHLPRLFGGTARRHAAPRDHRVAR